MEKTFELNLLPNECQPIDALLLKLNPPILNKASHTLRALTHPLRRNMLRLIHQEEYINVTEIYLKMGLEQTTASQHLAILREAGLVVTKRDGKCIFYAINYERLQEIKTLVKQLVNE